MGEDDRTFTANFSGEGVSTLCEVVKEKLKEFMGDYTDDVLVEYVIVLLKNGRTKDEAKNELDVFLGDDSDPFISWLWDHLESNLGLYVQSQETEPDPGQVQKTESHHVESESDKGNSIKTYKHNPSREYKGLVKAGDDEVPLPQKSVANDDHSVGDNQPRDSHAKPFRTLQSTIHKKRRRSDDVQQPKQREMLTVGASKRLLQFAVRDAIAPSRPSNQTTNPSFKRLRSVLSTTTDSTTEERPQRVHRASLSVDIRAMADAVKDVAKVRSSGSVFDRLGNARDDLNIISHREYGGVAEDSADEDFGVEIENLQSYQQRNGTSRLQEVNMSSFHDDVINTHLGHGREIYDVVGLRGLETTDIMSGVSSGTWVESSLESQYGAADHVDETPHRPHEVIGQPAVMHSIVRRNSLSVSMKAWKPHYPEEIEEVGINREIVRGVDTMPTKSEAWLMKENNNPTVAFNGKANLVAPLHESKKTRAPSGLLNAGPPTEDTDSRTIFVGNVHFASTKDGLLRHFNKFGEVSKVIILADPATGQPKGSAYIEFMRKEAADLALSLDGTSFMSRILKIAKKSSGDGVVAASFMTWPGASPFVGPRYGRAHFTLYGGRVARSLQWKRGGDSTVNAGSTSMIPSPTARSLTYVYVRADAKTNGSSGIAKVD